MNIVDENLSVSSSDGEILFLKRIYNNAQGKPVLLFHGSISNGRVFYSKDLKKGLAPFLASKGYDVYVPDLRGRGGSRPLIGRRTEHGLEEILNFDLKTYFDFIEKTNGSSVSSIMTHSWGAVMIMAYLALNEAPDTLESMILFSAKRRITVSSLKKWLMINLMWNTVAKLIIRLVGFLPANKIRFGSDNESKKSFSQTTLWLNHSNWESFDQNHNIRSLIRATSLPPILSLTGGGDSVLGHPKDVKLFLDEIQPETSKFGVCGIKEGFKENYGHSDILTSKNANAEIFPLALNWLRDHQGLKKKEMLDKSTK